ncbi:single-stranded-DNA-specific exonuclease RecJ [Haliangium ochraceum]|uniref:Single-stranded-DNA-specific exonuclease RecJ n=1 Tax=Haliangium ochraceum (strain DSM 14365 / JCM 11303 / SMP-2) TaxID=502025 RepID=D0LJ88_HALO1|nr:single-stranded-DNA-specific exonuclease RecJ [Haliangium ochraceum]ACY14935.1 single-stranded-DNA-specific exonuclease RecJ [Haliangium ochraceum DSM 14365]
MTSTWTIRTVDATTVSSLAAGLGVSEITARCLAGRGIADASSARSYLAPRLNQLRPPVGLTGLSTAVERLARAVSQGERIGIFGDYDVDGVTTAALMASFLEQLGASCVPRVARRDAGYGFGSAEADAMASAGCRVIITGDCGTSDIDAIERAAARGVDVIVVDHHTVPSATEQHPALALVNPLRADSTFPFRAMASVGLAFYLMAALRTELSGRGYFRSGREMPDLRELLDLVALGTVADLVPLQGENRILAATGLQYLAQGRRPGVAALMALAKVGGDRGIDERAIGWRLGPRLNAPGRMGDAAPALSLLLARDAAEAEHWAAQVEDANERRRAAQAEVWEQVLGMLPSADPGPAVVVAGDGWPSGITGIVASKLNEMFERPSFVIAVDPVSGLARGSGRAPKGFHLCEILARCDSHLVRFGGHAGAAGLTAEAGRVEALREALSAAVAEASADGDEGGAGRGSLIDAEVDLGQVDESLCRELGQLSPFGQGNEKPLLGCRGMRVRTTRRVGGDGSHLKLEFEDRQGRALSGIAFGWGERDPGAGATIDATFVPSINVWRGESRVELEIQHLAGR